MTTTEKLDIRRITVEYEGPKTGRVMKRRMVGDFSKTLREWDDLRQGKLIGISYGWQ
jgi:hypothetical protein